MLTFILALLFGSADAELEPVQNGFIDLSYVEFHSSGPLKLDGDWLYLPHQFLDPHSPYTPNETYVVPSLLPTETGYGTYILQIKLNPNTKNLGLQIPDIYSSYNLYINGDLVEQKGIPAKNKAAEVPFRLIKVIPLPSNDLIRLVLHTSNYHHHKNGINKSVLIGSYDELAQNQFLSRTFDTFVGGGLLVGFCFFLGFYFYGRRDLTALYFALFCFTYSIRTAASGNHMVNLLIPEFPWDLQIRIEYGSLYLSTIFFGYFVYYLFPNNLPRLLIDIYTVVALIFIPLTIFIPPYYFTKINIVHLLAMIIGVFLVTFSFVRALFVKPRSSYYSILSLVGFLIVLMTKTLDYFNVVDEVLLVTFLGQIIFILSHALILSNHFSANWREAKENAEASAKAKSDFLSVMSHEIRTPLNSVIGTTHQLLEENPKPEQQSNLTNLRVSSENLLNIVNNILDFNQIDSGNLQLEDSSINLRDLAKNLTIPARQFAKEKGLSLKVDIAEDIPTSLKVDVTRITQILTNLLNNAIKFTEKGSVTLKISQIDHTGKNYTILFEVIDTGIGIKKSKLQGIFDPFRQVSSSISRKYGGTGLGLTITKKLLELMNSNLKIESQPEVGSRFYFTLTLPTGAVAKRRPKQTTTKDLHSAKVLIVDDHELNRFLTKNFLEKWNSKVSIAVDGKGAIDEVNKSPTDLILMDIQMPEMDGFETTEVIRSNGFENPIIAITADSYINKERFTRSGIDDVITKPFEPEDLYNKIRSHLKMN